MGEGGYINGKAGDGFHAGGLAAVKKGAAVCPA
jgi:hypothetical protein